MIPEKEPSEWSLHSYLEFPAKMFEKVCRLCSDTKDLLWVFGKKIGDNEMSHIIKVMSGVEICRTDTVSQMVCSTCCQVTIKMFQFRTKSMKNDKDLKARYDIQLANAEAAANKVKSYGPNLHFSVKEIIQKYPKIVLPRKCLKCHLGAYITLLTDEIDDYLEENKLTYEDIGQYSKPKNAPVLKRKIEATEENNSKKIKLATEQNKEKKVKSVSKEGQKEDKQLPKSQNGSDDSNKSSENEDSSSKKQCSNSAKENEKVTEPPPSNNSDSNSDKTENLPENPPASKPNETEITLTSILSSQHIVPPRSKTPVEIIDVENAPQPPPGLLEWFVSRPLFIQGEDDVILVEDTRTNSTSPTDTETSKSSFVEALELTPNVETNNQPDLSLVSLAPKTRPLYTCRVCDSQHTSMFGLKAHERKTHTKCPFCSKRFRSLSGRQEHLMWCTSAPIKMKSPRLILTPVDKDEQIRKKYPGAFGEDGDQGVPEGPTETNPESDKENDKVDNGQELPLPPASLLENLLRCEEDLPAPTCSGQQENDVICISDEENSVRRTPQKEGQRVFNVVNKEVLNNISIHDDDYKVLKGVLTGAITARNLQFYSGLKDCPIVDGGNNRTKVFKNLRQYLHRFKIPIEVRHGKELSVQYEPRCMPTTHHQRRSWEHMVPIQLRHVEPKPRGDYAKKLHGNPQQPIVQPNHTTSRVLTNNKGERILVTNGTNKDLPTTLILASVAVPTNTPSITTSGGSLVLNPGQKYANFVLVPGAFPTVPQGTISYVQTVTTNSTVTVQSDQPSDPIVKKLASITDSLMPNTQSCSTDVRTVSTVTNISEKTPEKVEVQPVRPTIRVKNLKDLS